MFNLKIVYSVIFISLSAWVVYGYITTTEIIQNHKKYAHIINKSGKQRMLSQKTALIAKRYYETGRPELKGHLIELSKLMQRDHDEIVEKYLTSGNIKAIYLSSPVNLNERIKQYLIMLSSFIQTKDESVLKDIENTSFKLLPLLNDAVYLFENESNQKTNSLIERELFILIGTLFTLIIEAVFIVLPAVRVSSRKQSELLQLVAERTRELESLAVTDPLTKLYNRRKIDEMLSADIAKASRYNYSFSLVLIDIDYFKKVNDTYGHQVGDNVLQAVSDLLAANIRESDMVGRWGGEEFLIISREENAEKTLIFSEKLRKLIADYHFNTVGNINCSFGVAHYSPGDTEDSLIARADIALYDAKAAGRNCVKVKSI